jgi:predicted nucleic acid-binding protein
VPVFADTNVVVYAFAKDDAKVAIAEGILKKQPIISVQVLSEFLNVSRDKLGLDITSRHKLATELIAGCNVVSLDAVLVEKARQIEVQAQFSYWDALIVAAALLSGCDTLHRGLATREGVRGATDRGQSFLADRAASGRCVGTTSDQCPESSCRARRSLTKLHTSPSFLLCRKPKASVKSSLRRALSVWVRERSVASIAIAPAEITYLRLVSA